MAAENRAKLIEMVAQWYVEAGKYNVLPVDGRVMLRARDGAPPDRRRPTELHLLPEHAADIGGGQPPAR